MGMTGSSKLPITSLCSAFWISIQLSRSTSHIPEQVITGPQLLHHRGQVSNGFHGVSGARTFPQGSFSVGIFFGCWHWPQPENSATRMRQDATRMRQGWGWGWLWDCDYYDYDYEDNYEIMRMGKDEEEDEDREWLGGWWWWHVENPWELYKTPAASCRYGQFTLVPQWQSEAATTVGPAPHRSLTIPLERRQQQNSPARATPNPGQNQHLTLPVSQRFQVSEI